jgi:hypothetical protein
VPDNEALKLSRRFAPRSLTPARYVAVIEFGWADEDLKKGSPMFGVVVILLALLLVSLWYTTALIRSAAGRLETVLLQGSPPFHHLQPEQREEYLDRLLSTPLALDLQEEGTVGHALGQLLTDLRIVKRRLDYLRLSCVSVRRIEAYLEHHLGITTNDLERGRADDIRLPHERLASLKNIEQESPLSPAKQALKADLTKFVAEWRRMVDEDEFDDALGTATQY